MQQRVHIVVNGLGHVYASGPRRLAALAGVDLEVGHGTFMSIIGPSGGGKTTLLKAIGGLLRPTEGDVQVDGMAPAAAQDLKTFGYVFQDPSLLPWRTVLENIALPLQLNRRNGHVASDAPRRLVDAVGLGEFIDYHPHQLSGGMKQRVALARAMVMDPAVLLMDEPLGALDEITRTEMRYEILRLWEGTRKTVVLVTHSIPEAIMMSDTVAVMSSRPGRIIEQVSIDLPRPRDETLERSGRFLHYFNHIREALSVGATYGPPALQATA